MRKEGVGLEIGRMIRSVRLRLDVIGMGRIVLRRDVGIILELERVIV